MNLVRTLEAGREDFRETTGLLTSAQAHARLGGAGWSVLECIEHVVLTEERSLGRLSVQPDAAPPRDPHKETRLFTMMRSRLTKVEAPEVLRPTGQFKTLADALAAFEGVRERSIQFVREQGDALYSMRSRHPFFGEINGVELIHLIDGHLRRHADQIREICESPAAPPPPREKRPARSKKSVAFHRDPPDLPRHLETSQSWESGEDNSISLEQSRLADLSRPSLHVDSLRIEASVLERVQLSGGQFGSLVWKDVRLVSCDLSNVRAHRASLVRVEFIDCRFTGFRCNALDCQDVLIQNGDASYVQFQGGRFRSCEFEGCNLREADFQASELAGSVFRSCNLHRADLQRAKLQNTDFRKSELEGMLVGVDDLRGAIVDPSQAMVLAKWLGLQIL